MRAEETGPRAGGHGHAASQDWPQDSRVLDSALSPAPRTSPCSLGVQLSQKSSGGCWRLSYSSLAAVVAASAEGPLLPSSLSVTLPQPPVRTLVGMILLLAPCCFWQPLRHVVFHASSLPPAWFLFLSDGTCCPVQPPWPGLHCKLHGTNLLRGWRPPLITCRQLPS